MAQLHWKWEDEDVDEVGVGPVWIIDGDETTDWSEWVRRDVAAAYAAEHGLEFMPDE